MKRFKTQKGITLMALIITIIVLIILAVVAISAIDKEDVIGRAEDEVNKFNQLYQEENSLLGEYKNNLKDELKPPSDGTGSSTVTKSELANAKENGTIFGSNTQLTDDYGNIVTVPAGFKIASDSATSVTGGVVIEDATYTNTIGSQFVWIPVGSIKTSTSTTTITLGRYSNWYDGTYTLEQSAENENYKNTVKFAYHRENYCLEEQPTSTGLNAYGMPVAKDINAFCENTLNYGGYYLGRYEGRTSSSTQRTSTSDTLTHLTCNKSNSVYNNVTPQQSSTLCRNMYSTNANFTSDLINSYAYDTALIFIQTFSGSTNYAYSYSVNSEFAVTGTDTDKVCNIYDMSSNCMEHTTETLYENSCVIGRGAAYFDPSEYYVSGRMSCGDYGNNYHCARPLLYIGN